MALWLLLIFCVFLHHARTVSLLVPRIDFINLDGGDIKVVGERDIDSAVATTATKQKLDLTDAVRYTAALFIGDSAFSTKDI